MAFVLSEMRRLRNVTRTRIDVLYETRTPLLQEWLSQVCWTFYSQSNDDDIHVVLEDILRVFARDVRDRLSKTKSSFVRNSWSSIWTASPAILVLDCFIQVRFPHGKDKLNGRMFSSSRRWIRHSRERDLLSRALLRQWSFSSTSRWFRLSNIAQRNF